MTIGGSLRAPEGGVAISRVGEGDGFAALAMTMGVREMASLRSP